MELVSINGLPWNQAARIFNPELQKLSQVAEAFGLGIDEAQKFKVLDAELKIGPQDIVYITGDSGSGKSVLLRAIRADLGEEAIDLTEVAVDPDKPLIETVGATVEQGLELYSVANKVVVVASFFS